MPPWRTPEKGAEFQVKFLRLGGDIFVGNSMRDGHPDIALMDEIDKAIDRARAEDNTSVDGGLVHVVSGDIFVGGSSGSLQLPVLGKEVPARDLTIQVFRDLNPGRNIIDRGLKWKEAA